MEPTTVEELTDIVYRQYMETFDDIALNYIQEAGYDLDSAEKDKGNIVFIVSTLLRGHCYILVKSNGVNWQWLASRSVEYVMRRMAVEEIEAEDNLAPWERY